MTEDRKIRVLVAKAGLDGHDKGAFLVAAALRDAGMEVIYTGLRKTPQQVVNSAMQEDADVIGLSILSGAHVKMSEKILAAMKEAGLEDRLFIVGGVIPDEDIPVLTDMGVSAVYTQSSSYEEMVEFIQNNVK